VGGWLSEREAENALLLGLLAALPASPVMLRVTSAGQTVFAAFDGGHNLIVSRGTAAAVEAAAARLSELTLAPPGVVGPATAAEQFARAWALARGCAFELAVDQRIYELTEVKPPPPVPGAMRPVLPAELELVAAWGAAFDAESLPPHERRTLEQARELMARRTAAGELFGWAVAGQLVAMAGLARPTARTISVNGVYTPPAHRRRGHATALVAAISAEGLRRGKSACVLYTDLANPTSNSIYQRIGYRAVCESRHYLFVRS
jgi:GNAT superfamily N-acetyltransferase